MEWKALLLVLGWGIVQASAAATWPSSYDELEDIMLLNQGYKARQLSIPVTPCNFPAAPGRIPAAGFVRTAFHDVAPHDAALGTGGLDASIAFELSGTPGLDNAGPAFNLTLNFLQRFYSTQASMSDLIALALYTGVRGCGGPAVLIRTGRKDAKSAGALAVPKVNDTQQGFRDTFRRMGFSQQDMIKMVACGHTLGGVHGQQFPQIVPPGTRTNDVADFDNTASTYDNSIVTDFVSNKSVNPLVVGPRDTASDAKVFSADRFLTIRQMTDPQTFQNTCKDILQRMIDTVPFNVKLTEPIEVYELKPGSLQLTLSADGKSINFTGEIRVRTTSRPQSSIGSVTLLYKNRLGGKSSSISTTVAGTASGYDDSFTFYGFSAKIDAKTSVSSFDVIITGIDGSSMVFNNNGKSFRLQDVVFLQRPSCSLGSPGTGGLLPVELVAAVRGHCKDVALSVNLQTPREVPFPLLTTKTASLASQYTVGDYTFYKGTFSIAASQINSTTFDVTCQFDGQKYVEGFKRVIGFGPPSSTGGSTSSGATTSSATKSLSSTSTENIDHGSTGKLSGSWPDTKPTDKPQHDVSSSAASPEPTMSTPFGKPGSGASLNATTSGPAIAAYTGAAHKLGSDVYTVAAAGVIALLL